MSTDQRLASIQARISKASQDEARAQVVRESALEKKRAALAFLKDEFGVDSVEDARLLKDSLTDNLDAEIGIIEELLDTLDA